MLPTLTACVGVPVEVETWLTVSICEPVDVPVTLDDAVDDGLEVESCDAVTPCDAVAVWLAVERWDAVPLCDELGVWLAVIVLESERLPDADEVVDRVDATLGVTDAVTLGVGVAVNTKDVEAEGVDVSDGLVVCAALCDEVALKESRCEEECVSVVVWLKLSEEACEAEPVWVCVAVKLAVDCCDIDCVVLGVSEVDVLAL